LLLGVLPQAATSASLLIEARPLDSILRAHSRVDVG
jgi:hypothetical protein